MKLRQGKSMFVRVAYSMYNVHTHGRLIYACNIIISGFPQTSMQQIEPRARTKHKIKRAQIHSAIGKITKMKKTK